ncbi:MAG: DHA2 family efflux MFS transporter permease subunit [Candidatus Tectomicrobia bacterium]|nr:DHA2 family efflux MFS transporter permease subunit [Candidatus Tectomicrobia bacterium]
MPLDAAAPSSPAATPTETSQKATHWSALIPVCLGVFLSVLDGTMVNVAFPTLSRAFQAPMTTISWVSLVNLLTAASLVAVFGSLVDMVGPRRIYLLGFLVHMAGSLAVGLSGSVLQLILLRAVQAAGSTLVMATSIPLINAAVPAHRRGTGIALFEASVGVGLTVGPLIGGLLVDYVHWRAIFFLSIPVGFACFVSGLRVLPRLPSPARGRPFDIAGAAGFALGLSTLLLGITQSRAWGWTSAPVLALLAAGGLFLALFVAAEQRASHPMIAFSLFRNRAFTAANSAKTFTYMALFTVTFLMPFYLQDILGLPPAGVGVAMLPFPLAHILGSLISGPLADRLGTSLISPLGMLVAAGGAAVLIFLTPASGYPMAGLAMALVAFGVALFITPNDTVIMGASPPDKMGIAGALLALTRTVGMTWGIAAAATLFSFRFDVHRARLGAQVAEVVPFMASFSDVFKLTVLLCLIAMVLARVRPEPPAAA